MEKSEDCLACQGLLIPQVSAVRREEVSEKNFSISYKKVAVTEAKLEKLKDEQDKAEGMHKYGRFKAWLHYANLQSWQGQGHHFHYLSGDNADHCTCGLVLHENGSSDEELAVVISKSVQDKLDGLNLEQIQKVRGHVGLPALKGETVALIVDFIYREDLNDYLWTVICQQCGDYQVQIRDTDADLFVKSHNKICGPVIFEKKGR
jgi:hypothetical protein